MIPENPIARKRFALKGLKRGVERAGARRVTVERRPRIEMEDK
jgi:hypothetical protein